MADILELIKTRRSTRSFTPEQISRNQLEQILEAGAWAPSGNSFQASGPANSRYFAAGR